METVKYVAKVCFLGAFFFGFAGLLVGGLLALVIWPGSNLGPPVGAGYGAFWGALTGLVLGFVFGLVRSTCSRAHLKRDGCKRHAEHLNHGPHWTAR
jgi:hypothetical protein